MLYIYSPLYRILNMRQRLSVGLLFVILSIAHSYSQDKHVKNVIMLIPDGTSTSVLSLARWYKYGICPTDACALNIDKYICGLVMTHSSDAPIGDSAPTGSTYATGYLSHTGFIATYPKANPGKDLIKIDSTKAYQPLFTILEAAQKSNKATGLVVTCQFPHATPADFSAHTPHRDKFDIIAKQMVYNHLNVMFGGGTKYLNPETREDNEDLVAVLKDRKYQYITGMADFRKLTAADSLVWGLFAKDNLPFDLDTNKDSIPSLAEMTSKALQILSANKNGFFIMIEGSKVDWSAHDNDPVGVASEYIAFDDAVKVAMDFAVKDGNTAVVVCPDHGNSGISIGNQRSSHGYDTLGISAVIQPLRNCRLTADGLATLLLHTNPVDVHNLFKANTRIELKKQELDTLMATLATGKHQHITRNIARIITDHTFIGFNTNGHTGEDVMLANYHPHGYNLGGVTPNTKINAYMMEVLGLPSLDKYTANYYCIDTVSLKGLVFNIKDHEIYDPKDHKDNISHYGQLIVRMEKHAKKYAVIKSYTDYITIYDGDKVLKKIPMGNVAIYMDEPGKGLPGNVFQHFYIPENTGELLRAELK